MLGIEVVCSSPEDCRLAEEAGATRIELCSGIELGGLTPSPGLFLACRAVTRLSIMVMIRPRPGGFCYSRDEKRAMEFDVRRFNELGARGFVTGVLEAAGGLDLAAMGRLAEAAVDAHLVCHRACDVTPNLGETARQLADLGFVRMLTGGGRDAAIDGVETIRGLVDMGVIGVLPGGHVRAADVPRFVEEAGVAEVHLGPFIEAFDPTSRLSGEVTYGPHWALDPTPIREIAALGL